MTTTAAFTPLTDRLLRRAEQNSVHALATVAHVTVDQGDWMPESFDAELRGEAVTFRFHDLLRKAGMVGVTYWIYRKGE